LDYAAGGYHVSVTRGACGGTSDPAVGFADGGTRAGACSSPLNRDDLRAKWRAAVEAYLRAFHAAGDGHPIDCVKIMLATANGLADQAYAGENVAPPRDPVTQTPETPSPKRGLTGGLIALGLMGLVGVVGYGIHRGQVMPDADMW
jgi:hypothetical protein